MKTALLLLGLLLLAAGLEGSVLPTDWGQAHVVVGGGVVSLDDGDDSYICLEGKCVLCKKMESHSSEHGHTPIHQWLVCHDYIMCMASELSWERSDYNQIIHQW